MGQKVNPNFLRTGVNKTADVNWFAHKKNYADLLIEDLKIRDIVEKILRMRDISKIKISRQNNNVYIDIFGISVPLILGKNNANVKKIIKEIRTKLNFSRKRLIEINAHEIKNIASNAQLVANHIARQIENRVSFRFAQKSAIFAAKNANVLGIKTQVSGRLNGADMARKNAYSHGTIPLQRFNSRIDYADAKAITTYGTIGVKVWICVRKSDNNSLSGWNNKNFKNSLKKNHRGVNKNVKSKEN